MSFWHFTGQISINLSFKFIATEYIMSILQKNGGKPLRTDEIATLIFVMCRGVTRDITGP